MYSFIVAKTFATDHHQIRIADASLLPAIDHAVPMNGIDHVVVYDKISFTCACERSFDNHLPGGNLRKADLGRRPHRLSQPPPF